MPVARLGIVTVERADPDAGTIDRIAILNRVWHPVG
jgi:hypothetical protein